MPRPPDLIDKVLPAQRVNLVGGISDAGKTRWMLPMLCDWAGGAPQWGLASHPIPWVYVTCDRPAEDAEEAIADMGLSPSAIALIPAFGSDHKDLHTIMRLVDRMNLHPLLVAIEGLQYLCDNPNHRGITTAFLSRLSAYCKEGYTFLGVCESSKQKPHERYPDPRQRISGCASWGYHASTVFIVEHLPRDKDHLTGARNLFICSKRKRLKRPGAFHPTTNRLIFP